MANNFTIYDFAYAVLSKSDRPLTFMEIWDAGVSLGLDAKLASKGKTPWQSLGARLFVDVRDNPNSKFQKIGNRPARFLLRDKSVHFDLNKLDNQKIPESKSTFSERQLHPLLAYFVYAHPEFGRGREIYTKTIFHEKSRKNSVASWTHPDMVGFYLPIHDWHDSLFSLTEISKSDALQMYSFELKKEINRSNYRESFFQAVSNSSWANEGYLVATKVSEDEDVRSELARLSSSFGIGVIVLDLNDIDSSEILFIAKIKKDLDWESMNKLATMNSDFKNFVEDVVKTAKVKEVNKTKFDSIVDPQEYIAKILKLK